MEKIYVLIKVSAGFLESVVAELQSMDGIAGVDVVTGSYDMLVTITGDNVASMLSQVVNDLRQIEGIITTETLITLRLE